MENERFPLRTNHAPYRVYRRRTARKRNGRPVYIFYYSLWDPQSRTYSSGRSTGQTTRTAAEHWLALRLEQERESALTLRTFAKGMFSEGSEYLVYREQRGRGLSWNHRQHCATYLKKYILAYLGKMKLASLTTLDVERFQGWLLKQPAREGSETTLTPSTANHVVQALRTVTRWAIHQKQLRHDPFVGVEALASTPKRRGIFTVPEVAKIFSPGAEGWPDPGARLLNALACACGLRKGELQGLRRGCVQEALQPDGRKAGVLLIDASWERSGRLKTTKSGRARLAPVPPALYADLQSYLENSPWKKPEHFLFYSAAPTRPVSHHKIDDDFARALQAAGISAEERKARALSFHSWRHFANSWLVNKGLPPLRAQQIIGHQSLRMTTNYLHPGQDFSDVLAIQGELFNDPA